MKKRLHDQKAGIVILAVLFAVSLATVILHGSLPRNVMLTLVNLGEPLATVIFSVLLIFLAVMKKERLFYILCGGWFACFVIGQFFLLPGSVAISVSTLIHTEAVGFDLIAEISTTLLHLFSTLGIIGIGILLVEYLNDGSIYNRAFNIFCIATLLMLLAYTVITLISMRGQELIYLVTVALSGISKGTMVFLLAFYAYDTAKAQLEKAKL